MIELKKVSKKIGRKSLLSEINLTVQNGKIIGIIGENGSGKSTLLKLMAGLLRPTNGEVIVDGIPANRKISSIVAYMPETNEFYPYLSVEKLVDFYGTQFQDFNREKALEIIDFMDLKIGQKIHRLSKGNIGRLKIAVTLARESPYILLDEPLSGLDPMVRTSIAKSLIRFVDLQRQTVVITTHEMKEAEPLLDELIVLKGGKIVENQRADTVRSDFQTDIEGWLKKLYEGER